ncbi:MAG: ATP-dependent helicase [Candidatus Gastranaerophilales bacterium]|nr:ATP-dependent helicase [Candidatus Gastranaerophilales bacterium]
MAVDKLDEILSKLNDKQKLCVENLDGKFLVLAGPGTGKTYTVIKRLQAMILQGVKPERILCMTYSRAGAAEMKKRVLEELDENNNNVEIHTFHSFCNKLIGEYSDEFNVSASIQLIPDSIKRALIKECIDEISDAVHYKSEKANKYSSFESIEKGIGYLKRYRILDKEAQQLEENIKSDSEWLPAIEALEYERDFAPKKRKNYEANIEKIEIKIAKIRELYRFFNLYREKMELGSYIDYDDMINYILEKFESDPSFAQNISNQYDYIIIDEYQDTNRSQNELIFHLVDNSIKGNVFVVGDDKQIINASQGARIDSIQAFWDKYKEEIKSPIKFVENRRSTQTILDVARTVAEQNAELLDKEINLKAVNDEVITKDNKVRLNIYYDEVSQALDIVKEIDELINSSSCPIDKETKEKDYSQIAILSTSNDELAYYAEQLHNRNIPYELKDGKSIFAIKSSMVLYYYLQTLVNPDLNSDKLFRLLLLPPFNFSAKSFNLLQEENSKHKNFILAMKELAKKEEALNDIKKFIKTYEYLRTTMLSGETVYRVVAQCASKTGILDFFFNFETNKLENTLALKRLLDEAYLYSSQFRKVNLEDFVEYLDMLQNDKIDLKIEKDSIKMNAIQLTTYQSSKGLEYEYVYMPSLKSSKWESCPHPIIKPPVPLSSADERTDAQWKAYKLADKINKMYVGMTRAKHTLRLSYIGTSAGDGHSALLKVQEIPQDLLEINNYCEEKNEPQIYNWANALTIKDYDYVRDFKSNIDSAISEIKYYSPSLINPYLKCPRMFFFDKILGLNSPNFSIPDSMNFGSAVHKACENAVKYAIENKVFYDSETFVSEVETQIDKFAFSSLNQREQYKTIAKTSIKEFFEKDLSLVDINTIYNIEKDIIADFEGVQFKGLPDRVNLVDGKFRIFDYKTGRAKTKKEICLTDSNDEKLGIHEDYYIQMGLYKYFLEKTDKEGRKVEETTFLFPQEYDKSCTIYYSDDDIERILDKYRNAIKGIKSHNFEPTPCKTSCEYCPYKSILCNLSK